MSDLYEFRPVGSHAQDATISSATTLTPAAGARSLLIQAINQNVRMTLDGTTPTTTKGFQLKAGDPPVLVFISEDADNPTTVIVIEETATGTVEYQWGK